MFSHTSAYADLSPSFSMDQWTWSTEPRLSHISAAPCPQMRSMRSNQALSALRDIKENIELARTFVAGLSLTEFKSDRKTVYAVIRCLEIISEASRRLPEELKQRHASIPW